MNKKFGKIFLISILVLLILYTFNIFRQKKLEDDFFKIQSKNNSVKTVNRVGNELLYENLRNTYEQIQKKLDTLINESPRDERPPASPVLEPAKQEPLPPSDADKPSPPKLDPIPMPPLVIGEGSNADIRNLIEFVDDPTKNWGDKRQLAFNRLFPEAKPLPKRAGAKRERIRPLIQEWLKNNPQPS